MKSLTLALAALFSFTSLANTTFFDISCSTPNLHYVNSFEFEGTIEAQSDEGSLRIYSIRPELTVRKRGFNGQNEEVKLPWMSGVAKVIDSQLTKKPYTNIKLFSSNKKTFLNLNVDFPNAFSSSLRVEDGTTYKSTCRLTEQKTCLIPNSIFNLLESDQFEIEELGVTERYLSSFEAVVPVKKVKATHLATQKVVFAYYTFQDEIDGGNTYGEIVDSNDSLVATIEDSDVYNCSLF